MFCCRNLTDSCIDRHGPMPGRGQVQGGEDQRTQPRLHSVQQVLVPMDDFELTCPSVTCARARR